MSYLNHKPGSIEEIVASQNLKFREDSGYQKMFKKELEKAGKGIGAMTPAEKKAFFNKIDDKYKSKSVTLRTSTHNLLSNLSEVIVPGYTLSIPNTIDLIANKVSSSMGTIKGTTDENKTAKKA